MSTTAGLVKTNANPGPSTSHASNSMPLNMPEFWPNRAESWFSLLESRFGRYKIYCEWKKFCYTLMCFDVESLKDIRPLMDYKPNFQAYALLKKDILKKFKSVKGKAKIKTDPTKNREFPQSQEQNATAGCSNPAKRIKRTATQTLTSQASSTTGSPARAESRSRREGLVRFETIVHVDSRPRAENTTKTIGDSKPGTSGENNIKTPMETVPSTNAQAGKNVSDDINNDGSESSTEVNGENRAETSRGSTTGSSSDNRYENSVRIRQSRRRRRLARQARINQETLLEMNYYLDQLVAETKEHARRAMEKGSLGRKILRWISVMRRLSHPDYDPTFLRAILRICEDDILIRIRPRTVIREVFGRRHIHGGYNTRNGQPEIEHEYV